MTIEARVIKCIAEHLGEPPEQIASGDKLDSDLGCDSLDNVEIAMALEAEFDLRLDDDVFASLVTVQDVIDHVRAQIPAAAVA